MKSSNGLSRMSSELDGEVEISSFHLAGDSENLGFFPSKASFLTSRYPMKIWAPRMSHDQPCTWLFGVQFGGGLVEGDAVRSKITLRKNCCALYASLGQNKAYICADGAEILQKNEFCVEKDACLFVLPDPTLLQKGSVLSQHQVVNLAAGGNAILLDWYVAGREGLLEHWEGTSLRSFNSVVLANVEIFRDVVALCTDDSTDKRLKLGMGKHRVVGLCVVIGDLVSRRLDDAIKAISVGQAYGTAADTDQIMSCSPLYTDVSDTVVCGHVIRFCFSSTIAAYESMADILSPIFDLAGGNPFEKNY